MKHYVDSSVVLAALLEKSPVLDAMNLCAASLGFQTPLLNQSQ